MSKSYNPCDDCKYGIERRDGSGDDSMCRICEFKAMGEVLEKIQQGKLVEVVHCKDCKWSMPDGEHKIFCTLKDQWSNKRSFCEAMEREAK